MDKAELAVAASAAGQTAWTAVAKSPAESEESGVFALYLSSCLT